MSRVLLRSVLELRTPMARLPPAFLLPQQARYFNQTQHIVEPSSSVPPAVSQTAHSSNETIKPKVAGVFSSATPQGASASGPDSEINLPSISSTATDESVRELLPLLAAQPSHYITAHIHGRPYLVTRGDQVRLPFKMPGVQPGDILRLNRASVLGSRDYTLKGAPYIDERLFECRAVVLGIEAEPMRVMIKKKQRSRRKKHVRSKHKYTMLRVSELKINRLGEMER